MPVVGVRVPITWSAPSPAAAWRSRAWAVEVPTTASPATSAVLIIRAEAVAAVRRGSRSAFSRARWPTAPKRPVSRPARRITGAASSGASTIRATRRTPQASIASWRFCSEASFTPLSDTSSPAPRTSRTRPAAPRIRERVAEGGCCAERMASTGATLAALRDGSHAASTVTPTPTPSAATTGRGPITSGPSGRASCAVPSRPGSTAATPSPSRKPAAEATRPSRAASASTEPATWRREAPIARSSAISRVRRVTSIVKVLTMRKEPMNSETPAKTIGSLV